MKPIPVVISDSRVIKDTQCIDIFTFDNKHNVPIYEVETCYGLNQIIGYIKHINRQYGKVYYRGQCSLHKSMLPSIYHKNSSLTFMNSRNSKINTIINMATMDAKFLKETGLEKDGANTKVVIEAILQHYGLDTRCIDAVDNHWIALWFGLHKYKTEIIGGTKYAGYKNRVLNPYELQCDKDIRNGKYDKLYQYLILIAADGNQVEKGVITGNDIMTIDLREALPSIFLRPHAQHGIILRKNQHEANGKFDISSNVVCILKLRCDLVDSWLGKGELVRFNNLFPSQFHDLGYRVLLERQDLFTDNVNSVVQYIYD